MTMMRKARKRLRELAKEGGRKQAESAKHEFGEIVIDATGEYFPEEMKARRRRNMARGFALGFGAGVAVHYAMSR